MQQTQINVDPFYASPLITVWCLCGIMIWDAELRSSRWKLLVNIILFPLSLSLSLSPLAFIFHSLLRVTDTFAEFIRLLPWTAERLRDSTNERPQRHSKNISGTTSCKIETTSCKIEVEKSKDEVQKSRQILKPDYQHEFHNVLLQNYTWLQYKGRCKLQKREIS